MRQERLRRKVTDRSASPPAKGLTALLITATSTVFVTLRIESHYTYSATERDNIYAITDFRNYHVVTLTCLFAVTV